MSGTWPHQFTKNGKEYQIGEQPYLDELTRKVMAQPMICVHCHKEYVQGVDPRPLDPCPARSDKREKKRILNT
jgi:hypothetical protein